MRTVFPDPAASANFWLNHSSIPSRQPTSKALALTVSSKQNGTGRTPASRPRVCMRPTMAWNAENMNGNCSRRSEEAEPSRIFGLSMHVITMATSLNVFCECGNDCPGGTNENSRAFQRWVVRVATTNPKQTAETLPQGVTVQPSLRDSDSTDQIPGVEAPGYSHDVPSGQSCVGCPKVIALFKTLLSVLLSLV